MTVFDIWLKSVPAAYWTWTFAALSGSLLFAVICVMLLNGERDED